MRVRKLRRFVWVGVALLLTLQWAVGCEDFGDPATPEQRPPGADDIVFQNQVLPIFQAQCGGGNCHLQPNAQLGLDLRPEFAYASLVDVPSAQLGSFRRVVPGDADNSYLFLKISEASPPAGNRMPLGRPQLGPAEVATIRDWINGLSSMMP